MGFRFSSGIHSWTPVAHANGASSLANASYHAIRNANAENVAKIKRVLITGEATSSSVNSCALRRLSTNANTPTNVAPGPFSVNSPAADAQQYSAASTGPTIASTTHLLTAGLNAFGGIVGMQITPDDEPYIITVTAPNAEINLDTVTGTGLISTDMVIEEL